jgi:2-hydroxyacyl-CoA lyase 1
LLVLGGSSETHNVNKGAFQELDAISLLTPHTKIAIRPPSPDHIQTFIADAYRTALFGRPGPGFVDLPADYIRGTFDVEAQEVWRPTEIPRAAAPKEKIQYVAHLLKTAKAPLIVLGKGAAYAQAESQIRTLITR